MLPYEEQKCTFPWDFDIIFSHVVFKSLQANQSFHNNQGIVTTVQNAKRIVDEHTTQLTQLEAKSEDLVTRMDSAYSAATEGRDLEANTFTGAENMLDIMQNFRQKATSKLITIKQPKASDLQTF